MIWDRIFGRRETMLADRAPSLDDSEPRIARAVAAERSAASRAGYVTLHERERAKIRAATIALAETIGRPDLADPLR